MSDFEGNFVVVEGIDGSGTTTLCNNLREDLGSDWEFTQEPSNGKYGRIVREELQSESDPTLSDFFLFCADRYDHNESLIGPILDSGKNVITDRYNLSTYAYQTPVVDEAIDVDGVYYIKRILDQFVFEPDLTIYLDIPMEESMTRVDDDREKYENKKVLEQARVFYKHYARVKPYVETVDATQDIQTVTEESLRYIEEL